MKGIIKLCTITLLALAISVGGYSQKYLKKIQQRGELRVGMTAKQPPFCMKDKKGGYIGYEVELAEMLAKGMELKLKIVEVPFAELLTALENGEVDMVMSGLTMTTKRNMKAVMSGPYLISGKSILSKSASFKDADSPEDLNVKQIKIVALKGSTSEDYVRKQLPDVELLLGNDYDECIKMLEEGKATVMVADYPICAYTALVKPEKGLTTIDQPMTIEPIGVALPTDAAHFINLVENFLNRLMLLGVLDEMELYWFESGAWIDKVERSSSIFMY
jgi:polar amino acid transport system substrate-binding protein